MKKVMADLNLDVERLPMGRLQREQISRCYYILGQIEKLLLSVGENKGHLVNSLSTDFYSIIPHNYGVKKPVMIDHLLRVKDKLRMLDMLSAI